MLGVMPLVVVMAGCAPSGASSESSGPAGTVHMRTMDAAPRPAEVARRLVLRLGDETATVTLDDTAEARALAAMLPLELDLADTMGMAKVAELPERIDATVAERRRQLVAGEIYYWSPNGALAIVHTDLRQQVPPPGVVRLGVVDTGLDEVRDAGRRTTARLEQAGQS